MIEALITTLVQSAPARDPETLDALIEALRANGTALARSIARIVELVGEDLVDPGIALPALAMACATLADPRSTERDRDAARYEIETLEPVPDKPRAADFAPVVIPATALIRGPRR